MAGDGLADHRTHSADQVKHTCGKAGLVEDRGQFIGGERRYLARLEHDGASGGERRGDLVHYLV